MKVRIVITILIGILLFGCGSNNRITSRGTIKHDIYFKDSGELFGYAESVEIPSLGLHDCLYFYRGDSGNIDCDWSTQTEPYTPSNK